MKPVDWVMLSLVLGTGAFMVTLATGSAIWDRPMDEDQSRLVAGLISSSISIVSMYVGAKLGSKND